MTFRVVLHFNAIPFEKELNEAAAEGWRLIYLTVDQLRYVAVVARGEEGSDGASLGTLPAGPPSAVVPPD